jgi:hypothetical protein
MFTSRENSMFIVFLSAIFECRDGKAGAGAYGVTGQPALRAGMALPKR